MKRLFMTIIGLLLASSLAVAADQADAGKTASTPSKVGEPVLTKDNQVTINGPFYSETTANLAVKIKELDSRTESSDPIYLVINSPGGYIDAGLELIEIGKNTRRPIKTISMFAASMGFQTVQGLGERLITRDGTLMSHKARGGFYGEFPGQLDSRYAYYLKRVTRMNEQAVKRTNGKHTLQSYNNLIENEYWCDGQDCVDQGFADRVVAPSCDKSLEGSHRVVEDKFFYMGFLIEFVSDYDNCPINTNALSWNILIDGEPLFKYNANKEEEESYLYRAQRYFGYNDDDRSSNKSTRRPLNTEDLYVIQQKADKFRAEKQNRQVIKGY